MLRSCCDSPTPDPSGHSGVTIQVKTDIWYDQPTGQSSEANVYTSFASFGATDCLIRAKATVGGATVYTPEVATQRE